MYEVGQITGDGRFVFENLLTGERPLDLKLEHLFGNPPRLVITDQSRSGHQEKLSYNPARWEDYLLRVLQCEAVACKDWLTNKVDRSVTGRIACQQTAGPLQLPLNNLGVVALDYTGTTGIATSLGHAPVAGLINPEAASRLRLPKRLQILSGLRLLMVCPEFRYLPTGCGPAITRVKMLAYTRLLKLCLTSLYAWASTFLREKIH